VIGAVYLDGGITVCRRVVRRLLIPTAHTLHEGDIEHNPKGALQQACQCLWRDQPVYMVIETSGPSHAREFLVEVCLPDGSACFGKGTSRRRAEVSAAVLALTAIRDREKI
jgi:ribonuclease-3